VAPSFGLYLLSGFGEEVESKKGEEKSENISLLVT